MASPEMTTSSSAIQNASPVTIAENYTRPLAIVTTLFFMWGFITSLNDIRIQHVEYRPGEKVRDSVWRHPNLIFGALGIFAYVGAEVSIGSFLVNYFGQADIAGLSAKTAAGYVSFYWGGAMVGRFLGAAGFCRV